MDSIARSTTKPRLHSVGPRRFGNSRESLVCHRAGLAHRYALTLPGVATVTLGVKNRVELREALEVESAGPLAGALMDRIHAAITP